MTDNHSPGFEPADVEELRKSYGRRNIFNRVGEGLRRLLTSRSTFTVIVAIAIIGAIVLGYFALFD